jgi:hypothetical protein
MSIESTNTFNSKCLDKKVDPEVKIIHEWNKSEQLPQIDNLLVEFLAFLVDRKLKAETNQNIMKGEM